MVRVLSAVIAIAAAVPALSHPALAAEQLVACGERTKILESFADAYKEKPSAVGITDQGALIEVLVGPTGTWTMVVTKPGGPACIVGTGHDWHMRPAPGTDHLV